MSGGLALGGFFQKMSDVLTMLHIRLVLHPFLRQRHRVGRFLVAACGAGLCSSFVQFLMAQTQKNARAPYPKSECNIAAQIRTRLSTCYLAMLSVDNRGPNFGRLVLLCIDSYDSERRRILQHFSRFTRFAFSSRPKFSIF